ncbi:hypothetical protein [Nonomuraea salmonea]
MAPNASAQGSRYLRIRADGPMSGKTAAMWLGVNGNRTSPS